MSFQTVCLIRAVITFQFYLLVQILNGEQNQSLRVHNQAIQKQFHVEK